MADVRRAPLRLLVAAAALIASCVATGPLPTAEAAGTPPACPWTNNMYQYCNRYTNVGAMGSIGLVGDSVLLGSADGASNPGLPAQLSAQGWGPINLVATLGMKTKWTLDSNLSAVYWIQRWATYGFNPDVIAVNLGNNNIGSWDKPLCTVSNTTACKTQIGYVLDQIAVSHPNARIWWAKVNHEPFGAGAGYSAGMLGWNKALDELAATRTNLVVWDWPSALLTANPAILMDTYRVHPKSGKEYVKRSALMAADITNRVPWSKFNGSRVAPPTTDASALQYLPEAVQTTVYDSRGGDPLPQGVTTVDLSAATEIDPAAQALALTVTVTDPLQNGYLTVFRCGDQQPATSNLNFAAGASRTAQVITRFGDARTICVFASTQTHVTVSLQGSFVPTGGTALTPITPVRALDTRNTGTGTDLVVDVPDTAAVALTVTVVGPSVGGTVTVYACDETRPTIANLSFQANEVVASALYAPVSPAGTVCVHVETAAAPPNVILDVTGTFQAGTGLLFVPAPATRLLDTRNATGGWAGRHGLRQTIDVVAVPAGAKAVTATVTIVWPLLNDFLTVYPCGQALPTTSAVNSRAGLVMANSITVGVEPTQRSVCIYAAQPTHTLFDVVGWWVQPA